MKHVLLVTSPGADAPKAVAYAIERGREIGAQLLAVAVLDPEITRRIASKLTNSGFVGEKVSAQVVEALALEQRLQADEILKRIGEQATAAGVAFSARAEQGDAGEICARLAATHDVALAVLVAEKHSWLTRLFSGAATVKLPVLAGCDVKVMDE